MQSMSNISRWLSYVCVCVLACLVSLTATLPSSFSAVQHECIPQAILGMDVLCQAKSGMGKTAVFVLATLQQLEPVTGQVRSRY